MLVNIYGDDTDFITLWVIVIPYINSVSLLSFSTLGPTSGWLLVWILLFTRSALTCDVPVAYSATRSASGVLGRAGGSVRCMGFCAIPTCLVVLGVHCFFLLLLWGRLRSLALFVDSSNSFGFEAHSIEFVCYGYVSPACFKHLGCCGLLCEFIYFTYQFTVRRKVSFKCSFHF